MRAESRFSPNPIGLESALRPLVLVLALVACTPDPDDTTGADTSDSSDSDSLDTTDTGGPDDTDDTSDTGDTGDTDDIGDTGDTGDTGDDTSEPISTDPVAYPDNAFSGTRLKVVVLEDDVDNATFLWFHDDTLDTRCAPEEDLDGVTRCLPEGPTTSAGYFADSNCTQPIYGYQKGCEIVKYLRVTDGTGRYRMVEATARSSSIAYYRNQQGQCVFQSVTGTPTVLANGTDVASSEFVPLTQGHVAVTATLGVSTWESADGAVAPRGLYHLGADREAHIEWDLAGTTHAVPWDREVQDEYWTSCSEPASPVVVLLDSEPVPTLVRFTDNDGNATFYDLGATTASVVGRYDGSCYGPAAVPSGQVGYVLTNGRGPAAFPRIRTFTSPGDGMRVRAYADALNTPILPISPWMYETLAYDDASCWPAFNDDNEALCLPPGTIQTNDFTSGCTTLAPRQDYTDSAGQHVAYIDQSSANCTGLLVPGRLVSLAKTVSQTTTNLYNPNQGTCSHVGSHPAWTTTDASADVIPLTTTKRPQPTR